MAVVSVIVPVYKTKIAFLKACIESVLNQSYKDVELILVDDASPDDCGILCDEYSKKYPEIVAVHQECNKGVSVARNRGLEVASGEYLIFLDSDDTLDSKTLEVLVGVCIKNDSDVVLFDYSQRNKRFSLFSESVDKFDYNQKKNIYERLIIPRKCDGVLLCGVCCKFYRLSFLKKNKIQFPKTIASAEDQIFFLTCLNVNPSISYCKCSFYNYRHVENSLSFSYAPFFHKDVFVYADCLKRILEKTPFLDCKENYFATRLCQCLLYVLSKDVFHPQNKRSLFEKRKIFLNLFSNQMSCYALEYTWNSFFSLTERIGFFLCRRRMFFVIFLASLKWKY